MRYLKVWFLTSFIFCFLSSSSLADDPLQKLIEEQQDTYRQWVLNEDDLPAVFLSGDSNSSLIYSSQMEDTSNVQLCSEVSWEELIDNARVNPHTGHTEINFLLPHVRNTWAATCLIRPDDEIWVIGRGSQHKVTIDHFAVNSQGSSCDQQVEMQIRAYFKEPPPVDALFYSTDPALTEGGNHVATVIVSSDSSQIKNWQNMLSREVQFLDEYTIEYSVPQVEYSSYSVVLCHLKKKNIEEHDIGLPHELVIALYQSEIQVLASEKIWRDQQSGHVYVLDVIDFNQDGFVDVIVDGDREGCFFRRVFLGSEIGFDEVLLPPESCLCP